MSLWTLRGFIDRRDCWKRVLREARPKNVIRLARSIGVCCSEAEALEDMADLIALVASRLA